MGAQRILQVARVVFVVFGVVASTTAVAAPDRERVAVIDLGPDPQNDAVRKRLASAIVGAGLQAVVGDGVEDALAGISLDDDATQLAASLAEAQRAYGAFDCPKTIAAAQAVANVGAARQAGGLAVPELAKAQALILLCADRTTNADLAMRAAARLRTLGGSPDVPADVLAKYPDVDTIVDRELVTVAITSDVPGATIWIDYVRVGTAPLTVQLPLGHHILAAASGARRGWAAGNAIRTQTTLEIPTTDHASTYTALAKRVAGWNGAMPSPAELGAALTAVKARIALVRRGDTLELWGRAGVEIPHLVGGEDGKGPISDVDRMLALALDRTKTWKDRAPDPDQPLLVEGKNAPASKLLREAPEDRDPRTKWWVYATIAGAVLAGAIVVYSMDAGDDRQRVELVYP